MYKTILGRCIYQSPSGFRVYQNACYRWLTFGNNIIQTLIHRRHPARAELKYIYPMLQMVKIFPGDCCLLGLGGGGLAHALMPILSGNRMIAVDNSDEIINIAKHYFMTNKIPCFETINQNAAEFVQSTTRPYQHIVVDLHDGQNFPPACNNEAFFAHCKMLLEPQGVLGVNIIHLEENTALFKQIRNQFNQCTLVIPVKGTTNTLIFAFNQKDSIGFLNMIQQIHFLKKIIWNPIWGFVGEIRGV